MNIHSIYTLTPYPSPVSKLKNFFLLVYTIEKQTTRRSKTTYIIGSVLPSTDTTERKKTVEVPEWISWTQYPNCLITFNFIKRYGI